MDYSNFLVIGEAFTPDAVRLRESLDLVGNRANAVATGAWQPNEPLRFAQYEGTEWYDLLGTQVASIQTFSNRVLNAFSAAGVTGWKAAPAIVTNSLGQPVPNYGLLIVTGRSGPIDNSRSVQADWLIHGKTTAKKAWKGLYFEDGTWDGSDLFAPLGSAFFFATSKVKDVLEREKATNVDLEPLSEVIRPVLF